MKTLILGGTRFNGLALLEELMRRGHEVTVLNRGSTPAELPSEVEQLKADRNDAAGMKSALAGHSFDAVFDVSGYTPDQVRGALDALGDRAGHYIFTSSTAVYYGSLVYPIHEYDRLMSDDRGGTYGWEKVLCERLITQWSQETGVPFSIVRPAYVYGPRNAIQSREPSYFYRLEHGKPLLLPTRGIPLAHLVHVDDLAQIFAQCLGNARAYGQAYNGVGPEFVSLRGWFMAMAQAAGVQPEIVQVPDDMTPMMKSFSYQTRRCVIYSLDKAIRDLDYRPQYNIWTGMEHTYDWYRREMSGTFEWDLSEDDAILEEMRSRGALKV